MLDIRLIEESYNDIANHMKNRGADAQVLKNIIEYNQRRKALIQDVESARSQVNKLSKEIGHKKKNNIDATELMQSVATIKKSIEDKNHELEVVEGQQREILSTLPNILSSETPVGKDESENKELFVEGKLPEFDFKIKDHVEIGETLGLLDFSTAAELTGARFSILKGALAKLERALINYMIDFHTKRGYLEIQPPYIVNEETLFGTGQLPKFKEDLFRLEDKPWYLIPTAEVPLTNLKKKQLFDKNELPLLYCAYTPCFRSEAGAHGRDTRGLIRLHQFNKVEMVNIVAAEDSSRAHQEMIKAGCDLLRELNLPFRAVQLCSGDIGFASMSTVDLEVWLPSQNCYREISSISNCGDFQARRAQIRYRGANGKPQFAHTLNGSGLAVGRTLLAVMENYQMADGSILIPEILHSYMGGQKKISL